MHGVDNDEQLHQIVVDGLAGGLDDKHVRAADRLQNGNRALSVGETLDGSFPQRLMEVGTDILCQGRIGIAGEYFDFLAV